MSSSVLVLIIPLHKSSKSILTGKLFEYLASGKPVLCLGPVDGDAAAIIDECRSGLTTDYDEVEKISKFLNSASNNQAISDRSAVENYSRGNLANRLATVLNSTLNTD